MDAFTLSLALVAGAVAAFNPCGFALLPAYLTVLVLDDTSASEHRSWVSALRASRFTLGMTLGFVAVFGLFGVVLAWLSLPVERYLPVITVLIGVALVIVGVMTLLGRSVAIPGLQGRGSGPTDAWWSQVRYGVTFALASLSCTIGPFLAVTSGSLAGSGSFAVVAAFVTYALGMGAVVFALALATVLLSSTATRFFRRAVPVIERLSGVLLIAAGAYVAWYGWFELRVLGGATTDDPVIDAALGVQSRLTRLVSDAGAPLVLVLLVAAVGVLAALGRRAYAHQRS